MKNMINEVNDAQRHSTLMTLKEMYGILVTNLSKHINLKYSHFFYYKKKTSKYQLDKKRYLTIAIFSYYIVLYLHIFFISLLQSI